MVTLTTKVVTPVDGSRISKIRKFETEWCQLYMLPLEMLKLKYISGSSNIYTQTNNNAASNTCEYVCCSVCGGKGKGYGNDVLSNRFVLYAIWSKNNGVIKCGFKKSYSRAACAAAAAEYTIQKGPIVLGGDDDDETILRSTYCVP